jgi:pyridoxine 5-phosphate synthase
VTVLSVNLNKIALVRNSRRGQTPSVVKAARTVIAAGAAGITVHPRPDRRHIRPGDVNDLTALLREHPGVEFNIEGNPFAGPRDADAADGGYPGFDALIEAARPRQATLVPDSDDQLTSDHGWDLRGDTARLEAAIARYQAWGARVSLFMDPDSVQIDRARACGADRIELYTGPYAHTVWRCGADHADSQAIWGRFRDAARHAVGIGLGVNAGHDLDLANLPLFARIHEVAEVSIGHALISDALDMGLGNAVTAYLDILQQETVA